MSANFIHLRDIMKREHVEWNTRSERFKGANIKWWVHTNIHLGSHTVLSTHTCVKGDRVNETVPHKRQM